MDSVKRYLNQPLIAGGVGLVAGIIFGLVVLGWWLFPVRWTDAMPSDLTHDYQVDFMRMAIDSFNQNGDGALAQSRYNALGEDAADIYNEVAVNPGTQTNEVITAFGSVVGAGAPSAPAAGTPVTEATPLPGDTTAPTDQEESGGGLAGLLPWLCVLGVLFLAAAAGIWFFFFRRQPAGQEPEQEDVEYEQEYGEAPEAPAAPPSKPTEQVDVVPPTAKFLATYKIGDDLYDDSFSIDSPVGEFLGECGVGVSETIGVGETQKVTAFEVWLFDKNDIQTVTKVLMSQHAYSDNNLRNRLAAKGEPVMVSPGSSIMLETQALYMIAKVVDMGYGNGAMPPESYFDRFVLEMAVWSKTI